MTEIERQEEKDTAGMISLVWAPIRYITMTSSYERLRRLRRFQILLLKTDTE
jgi:hypothetical protein